MNFFELLRSGRVATSFPGSPISPPHEASEPQGAVRCETLRMRLEGWGPMSSSCLAMKRVWMGGCKCQLSFKILSICQVSGVSCQVPVRKWPD